MPNAFLNVHPELRQLPQWICWRLKQRDDGTLTKVPVAAKGGGKASTTDPLTWSTFDEAASSKGVDGIGFVFTPNDPFVGIDLDNCRDAETGEYAPWASAILEEFPRAYSELSPSGCGVHLIFRADWPKDLHPGGWRRAVGGDDTQNGKRPAVEAYSEGRYFTITGEVTGLAAVELPKYTTSLRRLTEKFTTKPQTTGARPPIRANQDDQALIEQIRRLTKFDTLWRGEWQGFYPSQSEADLALTSRIAYFAGPDAARIDSVFRQSGLYRDKWDERRGSSTVGADTIEEALSGIKRFYGQEDRPLPTGDKAAAASVGDEALDALVYDGPSLMAAEIPEPEWLVPGFVAKGVMTMLVGIGKLGKSVLAHQLCVACATGGVWLDQPVPITRTLYVNWEDPLGLTRARAIQQFAPADLPASYHAMQPPWGTSFNRFLSWLTGYIKRHEIGLVVIDPLALAAGWKDERDNSESGPTCRNVQEVAASTGAAILVVHHSRKAGGEDGLEVRGGSAIFAGIQGFMSFRRVGQGEYQLDTKDKMPGEHSGEKSFRLRREPHTLTWHIEGNVELPEVQRQVNLQEVFACILADAGITMPELQSQTGIAETSLRRYLRNLKDQGLITEGERMRRPSDTNEGRPPRGYFADRRKLVSRDDLEESYQH